MTVTGCANLAGIGTLLVVRNATAAEHHIQIPRSQLERDLMEIQDLRKVIGSVQCVEISIGSAEINVTCASPQNLDHWTRNVMGPEGGSMNAKIQMTRKDTKALMRNSMTWDEGKDVLVEERREDQWTWMNTDIV